MRWFRRGERDGPERTESAHETDARPAGAVPPRGTLPAGGDRRLRLRPGAVVVVLLAIFALGVLAALVGDGGAVHGRNLRREVALLRGEVAGREAEVARLRAEVERLETDPAARERLAREQLGLVLPGEIDFLLPRADPGAP